MVGNIHRKKEQRGWRKEAGTNRKWALGQLNIWGSVPQQDNLEGKMIRDTPVPRAGPRVICLNGYPSLRSRSSEAGSSRAGSSKIVK